MSTMPGQPCADALKAEGDLHFKSGDYRRALFKYREAVTLNAGNAAYCSGMAACHEKLGRFREMESAARSCLEADKNSLQGHFRLGMALKAQNNLPDYIEAMESGLRIAAETAEAAERTEAEAARAALTMAVAHLGTNPARVEQAERDRDRVQEVVEDVFSTLSEEQKQNTFVRAAYEGRDATVERLLAAGVDLDVMARAGNGVRHTALEACVIRGHMTVLELLLGKDADVEKATRFGARPLMIAALYGQATCARRLLEAGAAVNAQNENGDTALLHAAWKGHKQVVEALLQAGCDVDLPNRRGRTPLMKAATNNRLGVAKMLLEANANKGLMNVQNRTALQIAEDCGHSEIVALLQE